MAKSDRFIGIGDAVKGLSYVTGLIGFLSVVRHIGISYSLAYVSLCLLSLYFEYTRKFLLPRWLLTVAALLMIFVSLLRVDTEDFVISVVEALLILLAIKFLEEKRFRDYLQICLIALFLLAGSALLSPDIEFLLYFVCMIFLITLTIVLLTYYSQDSSLTFNVFVVMKIASSSSLISFIAIPATFLMFIVLPRTSYPALHFLNKGTQETTGFADNVRLGKVSEIQEDNAVIFRAHMSRVNDDLLYWRGIVFDYFDGTSWKGRIRDQAESPGAPRITGKEINQTIFLEPYGNRYLFAFDKPVWIQLRGARKQSDLSYSLSGNILGRTRYQAISVVSDTIDEKEIDRALYLQLPEKGTERIKELARAFSSGKSSEETVRTLLAFLRQGEYRYSLENLPLSDNPVEEFLFRHKYGNCEYFASAMALTLRHAGIPSRVVGGYRGGYYNDTGEYYLILQRNAHVWVEAYLENGKWLRVDPTPVRVENFVSGAKTDVLFKARLLIDTMNYYWNALIINYDLSRQVALFYKLRSLKRPHLYFSLKKKSVILYGLALLCVAALVFGTYLLIFNKRSLERRMLADFLKAMGKCGYKKAPSEGLEEFVSRIDEEWMRERAFHFVREFEGYYYRDKKIPKEEMRKLRLLINLVRTRRAHRAPG